MPRGCDHSVHVRLEITDEVTRGAGKQPRRGPRHFIVEYDADGEVLRIKERKTYGAGEPWERLYDGPYWKAGTHSLGNGDTLPKRVIAAAKAKHAAS